MSEIINITFGTLMTSLDDEVVRAVQKVGIDVNKEELTKALELYHNLVRCRECKYTEFCEKKIHRHGIAYSIDYCSYGEREGE